MRHPLRILATRIRNKIILPYLVIVMCVAVAMTFVAIRLTVGALQDRLDNRLIEAGQVTSDVLVTLEDQQLGQLRAMVFTQGTAEAFRDQDSQALITILRPHWANANLYSLVAFDTTGQPLISWTRAASGDIAAVPQSLQLDRPETRWIVQQIEWDHWMRPEFTGDPGNAHLVQCVAPVMEAGRVDLVTGEKPLDEHITFVPSPGHTPGHVAIGIYSQGERAIIIGDASHHPVQLDHPDWSPAFDTDPVLSAKTRDRLFDEAAADGRLWLAGHWQHPGIGRIVRLEGKRVFQAL